MNKQKSISISKAIFASLMLIFLIFQLIRPWTNFPNIIATATGELKEHSISNYLGKFAIFGYFTYLSNIFMVFVIFWHWTLKRKLSSIVTAIAITCMFTTTLIFWATIAPYMNWTKSLYETFILTYMHCFPFIIGIILGLKIKKDYVFKKGILKMIIFPLIYLIYAIILYIATKGDAIIYPFLAFENFMFMGLSKGASIAISVGAIAVVVGVFILEFWIVSRFVFKA